MTTAALLSLAITILVFLLLFLATIRYVPMVLAGHDEDDHDSETSGHSG